jgi:hypothetical protein
MNDAYAHVMQVQWFKHNTGVLQPPPVDGVDDNTFMSISKPATHIPIFILCIN